MVQERGVTMQELRRKSSTSKERREKEGSMKTLGKLEGELFLCYSVLSIGSIL